MNEYKERILRAGEGRGRCNGNGEGSGKGPGRGEAGARLGVGPPWRSEWLGLGTFSLATIADVLGMARLRGRAHCRADERERLLAGHFIGWG